ncbi:MAG: autotransporter domain-containing protein, partial [Methylobacillus sp.]|nr:autotransporter domain-containing protein [Methylobacillus sp.]
GSGTVNIGNNGTLELNRDGLTTWSNLIEGSGEEKVLGGINIFTADNTYAGRTTIQNATLQLGNGGTTGNIAGDVLLANNGALFFYRSTDMTLAGNISGNGTVTQNGTGKVTLTGTNSYSGNTTILSGTLQFGDAANNKGGANTLGGNINVNFGTTLAIQTPATVSATGNVNFQDNTKLDILTAANGSTSLAANGVNISSINVSLNLSGIASANGVDQVLIDSANVINGDFSAVTVGGFNGVVDYMTLNTRKSADGKQYLATYDLSWTAHNNLAHGTFTLTNATDSFDVGAALGVETANGALWDGKSLTKRGLGTLILSATNTYTGATDVEEGTLIVNGSITSIATIADTARLGGVGTVSGLVVQSGGTVAPGKSIGTLNVVGNVNFAPGSFFDVEIDANSNADKIAATGAATLDGTVRVLGGGADGSTWSPSTIYTILTASSLGGTTFAGVQDDLAFLDASLSYTATDVLLTMKRNNISFASAGRTRNERGAGAGAESLGAGALFDAMLNLTEPESRTAFNALSGEVHASAQSVLAQDSGFMRDVTLGRLRDARAGVKLPVKVAQLGGWPEMSPERDHAIWAHTFGSWGKLDGNGNAAGLNRSIGGLLIGVDTLVADNARVGFVGGYSYSSFDVGGGRRSSGNSDNYSLGIYGGANWGNLALRSGAAYSWHNVETKRHVNVGAFADSLKADYDADTMQVYAELGYAIPGTVTVEPYANLAYVNINTDRFREKGGAAALQVKGSDTDMTFGTLGLHLTGAAFGKASFNGTLGWRHAFGNQTPESTMNFIAGGNAFTITGTPIARNSAVVDAGLDFAVSENANLGVTYNGQFGSDVRDNGVRVNFSWRF